MAALAADSAAARALRLVIYGSRSFAVTVAALARDCGHEVVGMLDDLHAGPGVLGTFEDFAAGHEVHADGVLMGIGYNDLPGRWRAWQRVRAAGFDAPTLVHPRAYVAPSAQLGAGCLVMAGALVDRGVTLGEAVVVWPAACLNHDSVVGSNTFVSPSVTLCGDVTVGAHSFIGAAACVADGCHLSEASFVKMGERVLSRRP